MFVSSTGQSALYSFSMLWYCFWPLAQDVSVLITALTETDKEGRTAAPLVW
jgi:hypothetical protein